MNDLALSAPVRGFSVQPSAWPTYPEYKDSGAEWLDKIPVGWSGTALKRWVDVKITDGPHETPEFIDEGVPFISAEAVRNGRIDFASKRGYITPELHAQYIKTSGQIGLERGQTKLAPMRPKEGQTSIAARLDALSAIIQELNERYGFTDFSDEEVFTVQRIETKVDTSAALKASAEVNTPDNFRLSFDNFIKERFQELLEDNFKLYKKITDDPDFAKSLLDALFERYLKRLGSNGEALGGV